MTHMICMRGYSGSGKSTQANIIAKELDAVRVCRDDLRMMLLGTYWTGIKEDEEKVSLIEKAAVVAAMQEGKTVVIDATHLEPRYLRAWAKLAGLYGYDFKVADVKVSVDTCIYRDGERKRYGERSVGAGVIKGQAKRHPTNSWPKIEPYTHHVEPYVIQEATGPWAIMVDIDGTLAHMNGRSPFDYTKVSTDTIDEVVKDMLFYYTEQGFRVILCSGRDGSCRADTVRWLEQHGVTYDELYMRNEAHIEAGGGKVPDWVVKLDLFNTHIRNRFRVAFVLDDRDQVVRLWRRLGLQCFQVAEGRF